jgi:exopolysaccharide biosynthesis WecB/TagA/CpsF family protein
MLHRIALWAGLELEFAPGAYVVRGLFDSVIEPDDPVCILGGDTRIAESLRRTFGLRRLVQHIPPMGFIRDPEAVKVAIDFVASHPSRFVMVAMGPPQSEILCRRIALDGRATGMGLCIGSSLQVLTGDINPAPEWMERSGLVWLHRLAREPGRLWRRYLVHDMVGMAICLRDVVALRLNRARAVA